MIKLVEAINYRCLRDTSQRLGTFQVLVGPNASGKSTFLDVIQFLGDLLNTGLAKTVRKRSPNPRNLFWMGKASSEFELAVEFEIPRGGALRSVAGAIREARYEIQIGFGSGGDLSILAETLYLKPGNAAASKVERDLFPAVTLSPRDTFILQEGKKIAPGWRKVVTKKSRSGNDYFFSETTDWNNPFRLGPQRLALANLPEDEERFPIAIWVKRTLLDGIQSLVLNSEAMRLPAPPGSPTEFQPDGSNLPWAVEHLKDNNLNAFNKWVAHIRTALPEIETIETIERPEDKHRYLQVAYQNGLRAPSWTVSDGTLRLLALTLIPYVSLDQNRIYLIEEPENGIHPRAVETVFQSLSSVYDCQVLCASHSPVVLSLTKTEQLLCFAKTPEGATDIVNGADHPRLRNWKHDVDLGTLFATGVLG